MVDIDQYEMNKPDLKLDMAIEADIKIFLRTLLNQKNKYINKINSFEEWINKCISYKNNSPIFQQEFIKNPINSYYLIESLNKNCNENHIFVNDAGSANYVSSQGLKLKTGQREITSGAFYSMGVAIPLAIGASVSNKKAQVIVVTGDGSIEFNIQELRTVSQNGLNIKIFIINNGVMHQLENLKMKWLEEDTQMMKKFF